MKKLYIFLVLMVLTGCGNRLKEGHCYFNEDYSVAVKVDKIENFGAYFSIINRPAKLELVCASSHKEAGYISWDVFERKIGILNEVDCSAYNIIDKSSLGLCESFCTLEGYPVLQMSGGICACDNKEGNIAIKSYHKAINKK